jgi:hypothetical protein
MAVDEYRIRCAELATATARRDAEVTGAEQSYVDGVGSLVSAASAAGAALTAVSADLHAAQATVAHIDAEAAARWGEAGELLGWRGPTRLGSLPGPALSTVERDAAAPLRRIDTALRRYRLGPTRPRLPGRFLAVLPVLGGVCAALVVVAGHRLGIGALSLLVAPFPALLVGRAWAHRRYDAWLDVGGIGLTLLGGLLACGAVTVLLH